MKKIATNIPSLWLKTAGILLILLLSGSLFATGLMASRGCNMGCCCKTRMHSNIQKQIPIPMACCSQAAQKPCDMQTSKPFDLPEVVLVLKSVYGPDVFNLQTILVKDSDGQIDPSDFLIYHITERKFRSPPLFLKNQSFLI